MTIRNMSIRKTLILIGAGFAVPAFAEPAMNHDHGGANYHAFRFEADIGRDKHDDTASWDLDGWVGNDTDKLWLKSEGELSGSKTQTFEAWALYSRNVATFWDAQIGVRHDLQTRGGGKAHTFLVAGLNGLAPYFFDTQAHVFVRDDGAISARFRQENEILLTNRLIVRPRFEVNLHAKADMNLGQGSGLSDASLSLQTRYEITRGFAPYIDIKHQQKLGESAKFSRQKGEKPSDTSLNFGIGWLF